MLRVFETFHSISGEVGSISQGSQAFFVRLAGCNLRCHYCDTPKSQDVKGGADWTEETLLERILYSGCRNVIITGGEPLLQQQGIVKLIERAHMFGYKLNWSVETNGTIYPCQEIRNNCTVIYDHKCDNVDAMKINPLLFERRHYHKCHPILKYLVGSLAEMSYAREHIMKLSMQLHQPPIIFVSSYNPELDAQTIFHYLQQWGMHFVGINTQLHKLIDLP